MNKNKNENIEIDFLYILHLKSIKKFVIKFLLKKEKYLILLNIGIK